MSVLGGFSVEVDGKRVDDARFDRRRAKDLIALLAMMPDHKLRRYQAMEMLWPDEDYVRGPRKLYEATGEARKQLGGIVAGLNPLIADRNQGTVGFDLSCVSCDVDDFEREARLVLSEDGDDFQALDHARHMEQLYASGPDPHVVLLGERMVDRTEELKTLFVDSLVAAGEASLRLGRTKQAVRYASDAHRLRELREDVMLLLVQALRAAGRSFEIAALYRRYRKRLLEEEGVSPSLILRNAVSIASGTLPADQTA